MDILLRLRVLIWVLVLSLWGIMVYQYLGEEDAEQAQMAQTLPPNPYRNIPPPEPGASAGTPLPSAPVPPQAQQLPPVQPSQVPQEQPQPPAQAEQAEQAEAPGGPVGQETSPSQEVALNAAVAPMAAPPPAAAPPNPRSSLDYIKPMRVAPLPPSRRIAHPRPPPQDDHTWSTASEPRLPPGFVKTVTQHFNIYSEGGPPSQQFIDLAESLHGNLMLDLAAFSPWASEERVTIVLFRSQDTYRQVTGRPPWSGGASSVATRRLYVYESEELQGILAHELTHIYYDGFYLDGHQDPLWLSEGMATLIQVERGLAAPNWLRENLEILEAGGGYSLPEEMSVTSTANASDDQVRLWYAEAYSVVRFLIRSQYKGSFYKFSQYIHDGKDVRQALYRAYGMPFNRVQALEYAWRYDLTRNQMSRLSADNFGDNQ